MPNQVQAIQVQAIAARIKSSRLAIASLETDFRQIAESIPLIVHPRLQDQVRREWETLILAMAKLTIAADEMVL